MSASINNLLYEIVCLSGFAKTCEYCICSQNKTHQAMESPSHPHRCSLDYNCGRIYVSIERIAVIKKREKTNCDASRFERNCF